MEATNKRIVRIWERLDEISHEEKALVNELHEIQARCSHDFRDDGKPVVDYYLETCIKCGETRIV